MTSSRRSRKDDLGSTDTFSFLNNPDLLSSTSEALSGSGGLATESNGWYNASQLDNLGPPSSALEQLDFCGMPFNEVDFNSVDFMSALLNFEPVIHPNSVLANVETVAPNPFSSDQLSSLAFPVDNLTHSWNSAPSSSVVSTPYANNNQPPSELRTLQLVSTPSAVSSSSSREIEKHRGQARQISGSEAASFTDAPVIDLSHKVPIPRLHPSSPATTLRSAPTTSAQAEASPSPSIVSTNERTKLSHCAVERRYRTNMRQHIKNLREIVPALRVLELKSGNRISNLSFKPGTRRAGIDAATVGEGEDVIDERGYIDGVKVARNGSKTTAILKTIEYIRVLKRREMRLKCEQEGLKDLVRSFPGGPDLLCQWETTWRERFGGPEKDEIEEESTEPRDGDQDETGVDSVDNKEGYTSTSGRENAKRPQTGLSSSSSDDGKKAPAMSDKARNDVLSAPRRYIAIKPAPALDSSGVPLVVIPSQTTKRKRGRPRKNPVPPVTSPGGLAQDAFAVQTQVQAIATAGQSQQSSGEVVPVEAHSGSRALQDEPHSGQYLFAIFTFVSFFTSPLPISPTSFGMTRDAPQTQLHFGSVLTENHVLGNSERYDVSPVVSVPLHWREVIHLVHLAFSVYLVFSIMQARFSRLLHVSPEMLLSSLQQFSLAISSLPRSLLTLKARQDPDEKFRKGCRKLKELSNGKLVMPAIEAQIFREGLGLQPGVSGLLRTLSSLIWRPEKHEHWRLERRTFMRLVELIALDAKSPISSRLQMFMGVFRYMHGCTATGTELANLALVIYPIWRAKAIGLWDIALARVQGRSASSSYIYKPYETFVLETMSVDEAAQAVLRLYSNAGAHVMTLAPDNGLCRSGYNGHRELASTLAAITRQVVHEHIRAEAERAFVQIASGEQEDCSSSPEGERIDYDRLLVAGRSLDPPTVALLNYFDQVLHSKATDRDAKAEPDIVEENVKEWGDFSHIHGELKALVDGIVLCRSMRIGTDEKGRHGRTEPNDENGLQVDDDFLAPEAIAFSQLSLSVPENALENVAGACGKLFSPLYRYVGSAFTNDVEKVVLALHEADPDFSADSQDEDEDIYVISFSSSEASVDFVSRTDEPVKNEATLSNSPPPSVRGVGHLSGRPVPQNITVPRIVITPAPPRQSREMSSCVPVQDTYFGARLTVPAHTALNACHPPMAPPSSPYMPLYTTIRSWAYRQGHWCAVVPGLDEQERRGIFSRPINLRRRAMRKRRDHAVSCQNLFARSKRDS
ncbi:hypothetical protein A7U60_g7205 [Sanghuangporus baumii]|uniref:BHLH domain-containing protein n=1 Tax=Sanghuangporus baumii TaxID=108892 RepID=A0A9Q5HT83_SANBA|nr:hypothetical protein A7U60_g7205 [Sanghuangporus baumii]